MEKSHKEGGVYRYFSQLGEVFYQGMEEFMYSKSILSVQGELEPAADICTKTADTRGTSEKEKTRIIESGKRPSNASLNLTACPGIFFLDFYTNYIIVFYL